MYNISKYVVLFILIYPCWTFSLFAVPDNILMNKSYEDKLKILQDSITYSSNNQTIIEYAKQYYDLTKNDINKRNQAQGLHNVGIANWLIPDYNQSITNFYKSLELAEEIRDTLIQINSCIYLGLIYSRIGDWDLIKSR